MKSELNRKENAERISAYVDTKIIKTWKWINK